MEGKTPARAATSGAILAIVAGLFMVGTSLRTLIVVPACSSCGPINAAAHRVTVFATLAVGLVMLVGGFVHMLRARRRPRA
ncbi:MAG: hypothetical protein WDA27_03360 [Actinomycetota bacterium]